MGGTECCSKCDDTRRVGYMVNPDNQDTTYIEMDYSKILGSKEIYTFRLSGEFYKNVNVFNAVDSLAWSFVVTPKNDTIMVKALDKTEVIKKFDLRATFGLLERCKTSKAYLIKTTTKLIDSVYIGKPCYRILYQSGGKKEIYHFSKSDFDYLGSLEFSEEKGIWKEYRVSLKKKTASGYQHFKHEFINDGILSHTIYFTEQLSSYQFNQGHFTLAGR